MRRLLWFVLLIVICSGCVTLTPQDKNRFEDEIQRDREHRSIPYPQNPREFGIK